VILTRYAKDEERVFPIEALHHLVKRKERAIMVSPEYIHEQKPENQQVHSPAVEEKVPEVGEKKRTWLKLLMRVGGIVVTLVGGFAILFLTLSNPDFQWIMLVALLLGVVGALLFRSWWAILVILLAFSFGEFLAWQLAYVVLPPYSIFFTDDVVFGDFLLAIGGVFLAAIGILIGTAIVKVWETREQIWPQ
jgi:hypothetical protein